MHKKRTNTQFMLVLLLIKGNLYFPVFTYLLMNFLPFLIRMPLVLALAAAPATL